MKLWKRAWISITRRKLNSLVLLLIVFILANVLLTTLTVTTSLKNTKEMVLKQFPPIVTVEYNVDNFDANTTPKLSAEMAEAVYSKTQEIIKSYDYTLTLSLKKNVNTKFSYLPGFEEVMGNLMSTSDSLPFSGTQRSATNLVTKGEAKLIRGKGFTDADIKEGKPKAIISKQFAETNQLDVGSTMPVSRILYEFVGGGGAQGDPYFSEELELEIVGIIEIKEIEEFIKSPSTDPKTLHNDFGQIQMLADKIFVPNNYANPILKDNAARMREKQPDKEGLPGSSFNVNPEFILKDIKDLDTFLAEAKTVYNEKDFTIVSAASEYEVIATPLNSMGDLLDMIFKITVVSSIVILTLVLYIFMHLRQKEMGIFLALGERRVKIISQLLMETLIVALIGATLAIFTSMIFSNMLTDNTVSTLLTPTKELSATIESINYNSNYGLTPEGISQQVQGGLSMVTFVIFYCTMAITIFIAQIATVLYLLRLNPKKILM